MPWPAPSQGGTSTTWRRCKACIAFCVQQSLAVLSKNLFQASSLSRTFFQYLQVFSVSRRWMGLCSPRGRELFLARSLKWCPPRTTSEVSQTYVFFDGLWLCFQTSFLLLESSFTFFAELGVKSLRTSGCFDSPKVGKTRNSEDFAIWRTVASRQTNGTNGGVVVQQSKTLCCLHLLAHFVW